MSQILTTDEHPCLPYKYEPLPSDQCIRLLKINSHTPGDAVFEAELQLSHLSNMSTPKYTALSYTWKCPRSEDNEPNMRPNQPRIMIGGKQLPISENLFDFLDTVWTKYPEFAGDLHWIDAVCIDQDNIDERSAQVAIMREIYQNAEEVTIWVGKHFENSQRAMSVIEMFADISDNFEPPESYQTGITQMTSYQTSREAFGFPELSKSDMNAVAKFLERTWFHRVWTVQEVVIATSAFVVCGDTVIEWEAVRDFFMMIMSTGLSYSFCTPQSPGTSVPEMTIFGASDVSAIRAIYDAKWEPDDSQDSISTFLRHVFHHTSESSFVAAKLAWLLYYSRRRTLKEPQDRVFAIQSLATKHHIPDNWIRLRPQYTKSVETVFTEVAQYILETLGNLSFLCFVEDRSTPSTVDMPSWVPNLNSLGAPIALQLFGTYDCSRGLLETNKDTRAQIIHGNILLAHGCAVAKLAAVSSHLTIGIGDAKISPLLNFIAKMGEVREGSETRGEMLMKTWAAGTVGNSTHTWDSTSLHDLQSWTRPFKQFILLWLSYEIVSWEIRTGKTYDDWWLEQPALESFLNDETYLPSKSELDEYFPLFSITHAESRKSGARYIYDDLSMSEQFWKPQLPYFGVTRNISMNRRFFRTTLHNLGLCPLMSRPGDEVCLLRGSNVLFVLRRRPDGFFTFIGEAYLHGFMHGEFSNMNIEKSFVDILIK